MFRLSGVVMRISGGRRMIRRRSPGSVSPVRTATRISGKGTSRAANSSRSSASGRSKFCRMSLPSALRGDTYNTRAAAAGTAPAANRFTAQRNAARVLPLPVGAVRSTCRPAAMAGQASACAAVGWPMRARNHSATKGWNAASGSGAAAGGGDDSVMATMRSPSLCRRLYHPRRR